MASLNTNVSNASPPRDFDIMPIGDYVAQIIESDVVPTKKEDGRILKLTFEILEGPYANRRIWENLNIQNPNVQTQEIAQSMLKSICDAIGHSGDVQESEELHGQPMLVKVKIVRDKSGQYPDKNGISGAKPLDARGQPGSQRQTPPSSPAPQQRQQAAPPPSRANDGRTRPWGNGAR